MNVSASSQLDALAAGADNAVSLVMLRKALDQSASGMAQLLQAFSADNAPVKEGSGSIVDAYA